jgi:hypothetical protein
MANPEQPDVPPAGEAAHGTAPVTGQPARSPFDPIIVGSSGRVVGGGRKLGNGWIETFLPVDRNDV